MNTMVSLITSGPIAMNISIRTSRTFKNLNFGYILNFGAKKGQLALVSRGQNFCHGPNKITDWTTPLPLECYLNITGITTP